MTALDALVLLLIAAILLFEIRQEAGRAMLDATATLGAAHVTGLYTPALAAALHMPPAPRGAGHPDVELMLFLGVWLAALGLARFLHRRTRWSMDQFDVLFGGGFGLVTALFAAHVLTDLGTQIAVARCGSQPELLANSLVVDELRSFRSWQAVLDTLHSYQSDWR